MDLKLVLPGERIAAMTRAGFWGSRTLLDDLDDAASEVPDQVALTDWNSSTGQATTLSYRQLKKLSERLGAGLAALGVEKGQVVSFQLPNWWQFAALHLACLRIGAITNPLMPIFRERELVHMLGLAEAKVLVLPHRFRDFDYPQMVAGIRDKVPALKHVLVVGGAGDSSFESFAARRWEDEVDAKALFAARRQGANEVMQILYTSGTTGESKGVMHTANTIFGNLIPYIARLGLTSRDSILMASPLAHQTGFIYGVMMAIRLKTKLVLLDAWSGEVAARRIADEACAFTMASTPFLADLANLDRPERIDLSSLRMFVCGGAPIPEALAKRAVARLRCTLVSAWGMTENGAVTITSPGDPEAKIFGTDGNAVPGMELIVLDPDGKPCPPDSEGDLKVRGASNFVGYLKRPELYGMDEQGWFDTGDRARMDADGYIRITGRTKDIIIRGGENIPVIEVESLLYRHPAIQDAALVAMPDPRLGERACAFVTVKPGAPVPTLDSLGRFLAEQGMTKNYFPERLEIVAEMPRTPSGKIQKFKLRETARAFGA
ncbi:MAG: AMP-binding protein [Rhodospirillales bacterium]|nr:AMP-binding protein [Rhodospirillales bacterium]